VVTNILCKISGNWDAHDTEPSGKASYPTLVGTTHHINFVSFLFGFGRGAGGPNQMGS